MNHDPHLDLAARRPGALHAGGAGDTARHDRRADDRGKLTAVVAAAGAPLMTTALLLLTIGAPHEHGG
ncbi:hypothetical protein GCM10020358_36930 [Amorphoplanes nipponensis]